MNFFTNIKRALTGEKSPTELQQERTIDALANRLSTLEESLQIERQTAAAQAKELERLQEIEHAREARMLSTEPWVEITGETIDPVRGVQIALDWNPAFIQYLKENGITGRDEDEAVQRWLALLYKDMTDRLETRVISNTDIPRTSDYV